MKARGIVQRPGKGIVHLPSLYLEIENYVIKKNKIKNEMLRTRRLVLTPVRELDLCG